MRIGQAGGGVPIDDLVHRPVEKGGPIIELDELRGVDAALWEKYLETLLWEKYNEVCETSAMLRADMAAARERQAKLRDENAKLRELVIRADKLMQGVLDNADGTVVVSELPCCDTLLDNLEIYREDMRELGIEVEHERNHQ